MAEGLVGKLFGPEEEAPAGSAVAEAGGATAAAATLAAALALDLAKDEPDVARATARFLEQHTRLLELQALQSEDDEATRLAGKRGAASEARLRRVGQRIRVAVQACTLLVGLLVAAVIGLVVNDARHSQAVVVDAFDAPPDLADEGLSGRVVAAGLVDELQKMQDATRSPSVGLTTQKAWESDVKIEVPETGVSFGEINRMLHARLGHDVHVSGELVVSGKQWSLTVRGDGVPPTRYSGPAGDLAPLLRQAAEHVYGRSQPSRYAAHLLNAGRNDDAIAFLPGAYARAVPAERAELANLWGNAFGALNDSRAAADKYRLALSLRPNWWKPWGNLVGALSLVDEEAGWKEGRRMMTAVEATPADQRPEPTTTTNWGQISQDWPLVVDGLTTMSRASGGAGTLSQIVGPALANAHARLHDPTRAQQALVASDPADPTVQPQALLLQAYAAVDRGDLAAAIVPLESFWTAWRADTNLRYAYNEEPCLLGLAYGWAGRTKEAEAVFAETLPLAYCHALRGDVLERNGDLAGAERVWAEALRVGPDLSPVRLHRGLSEVRRGLDTAADADFAAAQAASPHWADPLKAWGDLLARRGRWADARAKYDEALKYAPAWSALRDARAAAAGH